MMIRKRIIFFSMLVALLLIFSSCERTGDPNLNSVPEIEITSYGGVLTDSLAAAGDSIIFQQTIYWEAHDTDGWVEAFAYRILDENGNAISTPEKEYIYGDVNGNGVTDDDEGWVLHYQAGANESIPLSSPEAKSTIWTDEVYTVVNFPAYGEVMHDPVTGDVLYDPDTGNVMYSPVTSIFEIKCVDDRGDESRIYRRYYKSTSKTPSILAVESTQGPIDEKRIGTGVVLKFRIDDTDPLIGPEPNYFLFKLEIRDTDGNVVDGYNPGPHNGWYSTQFQDDVTEFMLIPEAAAEEGSIGPFIVPNTLEGNTFTDSTYLTVIAYDLAGIPSEPVTISFAVKEGFYPGTMIYNGFNPNGNGMPDKTFNDIFALGEYHYSTRKVEFISDIDVPEEIAIDEYHYGLPLWVSKDSVYTAVNSPDLKIYMHWGYEGEYGAIGQEVNTVTNSPFNQKIGEVLDEQTDSLYFSELKYFDLQLDEKPYFYAPLAGLVDSVLVDGYGWFTRIPVGSDIAQRTILYDLASGDHVFRVRAVDLSNIGDPTPAEMRFRLVDPIMADQKEHKILIIDEDKDDYNFAPDTVLDSLYEEYLADYSGEIVHYDLWDISTSQQEIQSWNSLLHFDNDQLSPTEMLEYELVIYHNDKNSASSRFHRNNDCLEIFFKLDGNMIAALSDNFYNVYDNCNNSAFFLLQDNFGIPVKATSEDPMLVDVVSQSYFTNPFLTGVSPVNPISTTLEVEFDNAWTMFIPQKLGVGPCAYMKEELFETSSLNPDYQPPQPIFRYVCKPVPPEGEATVNDPSQEQYDLYNDKAVGLRYQNGNSTNYLFGFSLTTMKTDQVKTLFNEILTDLGIQ